MVWTESGGSWWGEVGGSRDSGTAPYISGDAGCRSVNGFLSWMNNYRECAVRGRRKLYPPKPSHPLCSSGLGWGMGGGHSNKQISQRERRRTESLFFRLREGWDVDKACNWECSAKLIWQVKVYGVSSELCTHVKCPFASLWVDFPPTGPPLQVTWKE